MTILILSIIQILLLDHSQFKDLHIAFAQSTNATSIFVPSNMNKMEITLKNDQSANPYSLLDSPLLIAAISGLTAVFGGYMGSYMTNRSNRKLEADKYKREQEKQGQLNSNVRALTLHNLKMCSYILEELMMQNAFESKSDVLDFRLTVESFHREYSGMGLDMKIQCFKPEVLTALQKFYDFFELLSVNLFAAFSRYDKLSITDERDALDKLRAEISSFDIGELNKLAKEAIDILEKNI